VRQAGDPLAPDWWCWESSRSWRSARPRGQPPPGDVDGAFAAHGVINDAIPGVGDTPGVPSVAVGPDGSILVSGDSKLARYTSDGALDLTFGGDGLVDVAARDLVVQPDGRIVLAQTPSDGGDESDIAFVRLMPNGAPDPTFWADGVVRVDTDNPQFVPAARLVLDAQGRIVAVAGHYVVRLLPDGNLDSAFSGDGIQELPGDLYDLAVRGDGSAVITGTRSYPEDVLVFGLDPLGQLDPAFGDGGIVVSNLGGIPDIGSSIAIDAAGRIVVGANAFVGPSSKCDPCRDHVVVRYDAAGAVDTSFKTAFSYSSNGPVLSDGDGGVLDIGARRHQAAPAFGLMRLRPSGLVDRRFGFRGRAGVFFGRRQGSATDAAVAPDGNRRRWAARGLCDRALRGRTRTP
jgi:uncharacterized delta-60 repeat protein